MQNNPDLQGVKFVSEKAEVEQFLQFPYDHYSNDKHWVQPLRIMQKELINTKKNPFYKNAEIAMFLAEYNGKPAGRIAAIHNRSYNDFNDVNVGFFGFFESIDKQGVTNLLFRVAEDWLKQRNATKIIGPVNPSFLDEIGIMVEGFDQTPAFMMPYNKPYYDTLLKEAGFQKAMDLLMYRATEKTVALDRVKRAEEIVKKRIPGITIRPINLNNFKKEVAIIHDLFNKAWATNWGLNHVEYEQIKHLAKSLKLIIDKDFAHVAEVDGKPIGFSIALPDLNQVLKKIPDGKLFPTGIFKLLYHKRKITGIRTALMGILPEYQGKGIDVLLHKEAITNGLPRGFNYSEMGWLLETNKQIITVVEKIGGKISSRYRMYEREIGL